jgi:cell division protein FtsA
MSKARDNKKLVVGLDIGTSKIAAIVAEIKPEGGFEIIGMGNCPARGLKKGVVVNIETTVTAIQRALEEAELMADCKITDVYTGIAGSHIKSFNSQGMVAIKDKEVGQMDIDRVIETAKAVQIPNDQQILHILNQEFIIDGQEDVREPLGMSGVRLEVKVHIVTGAVSAALCAPVTMCTYTSRRPPLMPIGSFTSWPSITNSCGSTSSSFWSLGMLIALAVSTTRATSTGVTSLSRTITMPVEFWPRMWLPVMPV